METAEGFWWSREHDLRAMLYGIGYLTRYGIEWRALPVDFPPWPAAYAFFDRWSQRGQPQAAKRSGPGPRAWRSGVLRTVERFSTLRFGVG